MRGVSWNSLKAGVGAEAFTVMATVGGFDLLMTTVTLSTEASSTSAGSGGSFDFQGQRCGSAARSGKLAVITAANAIMAPIRIGRFMRVSLASP
jgi:hypothetical protein